MGQRNMMVDLEMQQQSQGYVQPGPCIVLGSLTSFPQPDVPGVIAASGNIPNLEAQPLPEPHDNPMFYGIPQYPCVQHPHHHASSLDVDVSTAPNFYLPYVNFHAPPSQLPSSSSHGEIGVTSYKRKNAEGTTGNSQYLSTVPAPSSFAPLNTAEPAPFSLPQFGQRSGRNRPGATPTMDTVRSHGQNNFIHGNYAGQPFPPPGSIWFDQRQMSSGRTDRSPLSWSPAPSVPYMAGSRNPAAFIYPSPLNPRHHYFSHHPSLPPPVQGIRSHNATVYPHMALASYRVPANYEASEMGSTHVGPVQPSGFRMFQHHREDSVPEATTLRHRGFPHLRVLPADEVALLDVGDFYDAGTHIDHHRDMRLDIEDMSYEELLALSERIGAVNTGLSEERVNKNLKTKTYLSTGINLEEAPPATDLETDSCTICQENYKNQEEIGTLDCGHEYHAECLKKWLLVKNVCPICKSEALAI